MFFLRCEPDICREFVFPAEIPLFGDYESVIHIG